jgi:uncharacterized protein YifE (UPF0438 family)
MSTREEHKRFLLQRTYKFGINDFSKFSKEEIAMLNRYGTWLEALASEVIAPITADQMQFVEVAKGLREPCTAFERAWTHLLRNRASELDPGFTPPKQLPIVYSLCPACNKNEVQGGKTCVQCKIASGEIDKNTKSHKCPVCHSTVISSDKVLVCSDCIRKSVVSHRYLDI